MENLFDNISYLPQEDINTRTESLIGFESKYDRAYSNLKLFLDPDAIQDWSKKHHGTILPIVKQLEEKYSLIILEGDAGTGKTVSAEGIADRMARDMKKEGRFIKLSTRVRGEGLHGQMSNLVNDAFEKLSTEAGKKRLAFLLIDEADAIATTRGTSQMHQEEKAAVNTLIQKIDEIRKLKGRAIVFMSTNRLHYLDEAIIRRAAVVLSFERPNKEERIELFQKSLAGLDLSPEDLNQLADLTGQKDSNPVGYSFSDLRLKVLPEALAKAYPQYPLGMEHILDAIKTIPPSPEIT
ncbi:MAG TPA: AAA family ATPase [Cytophagales bacterium]|nr:AAA family ATPase [Cytophagales bacterium]